MASQDAVQLVNRIETVLKTCYVISASFADIEKGTVNKKRRRVVYVANCFIIIICILHVIWSVAPLDSTFYFYIPNPYYAYGRIGRLLSAAHVTGFPLTLLYSMIVLRNEVLGFLSPVTNLKRLFDKLPHPSDHEVNKLTFLLKMLPYIPVTNLFCTFPLVSIMFIGSVITSYLCESWLFFVVSIPEVFIDCVSLIHGSHTYSTINALIAQSSRYFLIRLDRVNAFFSRRETP